MAFCTECGFQMSDSAAFCPNCGNRQSEQKSEAAPPPQDTSWADIIQQTEAATVDTSRTYAPPPVEDPYNPYQPNYTDNTPYSPGGYDYGYQYNQNAQPVKSKSSKTAIIVIASVLVLLVAAVVIILQSTGKDPVDPSLSSTPPVAETHFGTTFPTPTPPPPSSANNVVAGSGYVENGRYFISFIGAEQFIDTDNEYAIRIYYEFTNKFTYPQAAWFVLDWKATQDGVVLDETECWEDVEVYYHDFLNVRSGLTIQCCLQFKYNPDGGKVDLSIYGYNSDMEGGNVSCTYMPDQLPGAPAPYVFQLFADPQWTLNYDAEGFLDDGEYYVAVTDAELVTDYYGDPAIRVYYEFTNYSGSYVSLYDALDIYTYQDGIELYQTYTSVDSETDENLEVEIGYGATISASCVYLLRNNNSSVEAEVEASTTYNAIGQTFRIR